MKIGTGARRADSVFLIKWELAQEKEHLEMQQRVTERELSELRDKLMVTNRSLGLASNNMASQEATISTLRSIRNTHRFWVRGF